MCPGPEKPAIAALGFTIGYYTEVLYEDNRAQRKCFEVLLYSHSYSHTTSSQSPGT